MRERERERKREREKERERNACDVMVINIKSGHSDLSSNSGQGCLHYTLC